MASQYPHREKLLLTRRAAGATRTRSLAKLRCAYFAHAAESAARYGVTFERLLLHLWQARQVNRRLLMRSVVYIDDLVHAVACVDQVGLAWADLVERYERALIRRCRGTQDEIEATLFVRRLFADLKRRNEQPCSPALPSFRNYIGNRPLRNWLADRLNAARSRDNAVPRAIWRPAGAAINYAQSESVIANAQGCETDTLQFPFAITGLGE